MNYFSSLDQRLCWVLALHLGARSNSVVIFVFTLGRRLMYFHHARLLTF